MERHYFSLSHPLSHLPSFISRSLFHYVLLNELAPKRTYDKNRRTKERMIAGYNTGRGKTKANERERARGERERERERMVVRAVRYFHILVPLLQSISRYSEVHSNFLAPETFLRFTFFSPNKWIISSSSYPIQNFMSL